MQKQRTREGCLRLQVTRSWSQSRNSNQSKFQSWQGMAVPSPSRTVTVAGEHACAAQNRKPQKLCVAPTATGGGTVSHQAPRAEALKSHHRIEKPLPESEPRRPSLSASQRHGFQATPHRPSFLETVCELSRHFCFPFVISKSMFVLHVLPEDAFIIQGPFVPALLAPSPCSRDPLAPAACGHCAGHRGSRMGKNPPELQGSFTTVKAALPGAL